MPPAKGNVVLGRRTDGFTEIGGDDTTGMVGPGVTAFVVTSPYIRLSTTTSPAISARPATNLITAAMGGGYDEAGPAVMRRTT